MKLIIIFILFLSVALSAQIDKSFYEKIDDKLFYENIEKNINISIEKNEFSEEITNFQKVNLKRLKELISKEVIVDEFDKKSLLSKKIDPNFFINALIFLSENKYKLEKQRNFLNDIQNRLSYFKKSIEGITEENKSHLLSYQLQFAYYKIQKNNIEERLKKIESNSKELFELIINSFSKVDAIDVLNLEKLIKEKEILLNKYIQTKISLEIDVEKENISDNNSNVKKLNTQLQTINNKIDNEYLELIKLTLKKSLVALKNKNQNLFFENYSLIELYIDEMHKKDEYVAIKDVMKELSKLIFGNTKLLLSSSIFQGKDLLNQVWTKITSTLFVFNEQAISLFSLIKAILFIIVGFTVGLFYKKWLLSISKRWPNMSQMSLKLTSNVGFYLIIIITFMITMSSLGIDMSSISLIAGALSIGIGFGLQTVVSNLIAGIILMFERTIRIGDIIEITDLLKGTVTDIRIRSTTIKTFDNIDIVVPNSSFIQNNVINWTLEDPSRRLHIPFGVAYGTKVEKVKEVILSELEKSDLKYIKNIPEKTPEIRMENMNTSSVDFELLVWIKSNDRLQPNSLKSDFLILIYNSLYKHNIEIPFPQLDLHLKKGNNKDEK